jgi:DNA repair protein RecO (recombination protein O)
MLTTTRALVLRTIRHADHRLILKAFTEQYGLRSYVVRVGRKGGVSEAALQALTRVELVADERSDRDLLVLRDLRVERPYMRIPFDPVRAAVALFVQEVLVKLLRGEAADPQLYGFLEEAVEQLDSRADLAHYPLQFLLQLSAELGFMPEPPLPGEDRFDLKEGHFTSGAPQHGQTLPPALSAALASLLPLSLHQAPTPPLPSALRRDLLDHLLLYYRLHIDGLGELRSPGVLQQVLG